VAARQKIAYHDACHLANAQGVARAAKIAAGDSGVQCPELPNAHLCCAAPAPITPISRDGGTLGRAEGAGVIGREQNWGRAAHWLLTQLKRISQNQFHR